MRKILHLFGRMNRGGAELRTLEVMRYLGSKHILMHFGSLSGLSGDLDNEICDLGGKVHLLPLYTPGFPLKYIRLLRQQRYDIVQSHVHYPSGFLLQLAAYVGVPTRITSFRNSQDGKGNSPSRRMQRLILKHLIQRYSTHVVAVSASAMTSAWWPDWCRDPRCQVIYNGIDPKRFQNLEEPAMIRQEFQIDLEADLYIHVGRLDAVKNHHRLLMIFKEIVKQRSKSCLLLVGRGENELGKMLRETVAKSGLEKQVVFAGLRSDIPHLLNAADCMIFPSLYEGLPGAVLEASAAGIPVLASDLPVIQEIAAFLSNVKSLSLDETNETWALKATSLLLAGKQKDLDKKMIRKQFASSPFTIASCSLAYQKLWLNSSRNHV
jgi:glycosyltransferase involved in cell wall biosynthesis